MGSSRLLSCCLRRSAWRRSARPARRSRASASASSTRRTTSMPCPARPRRLRRAASSCSRSPRTSGTRTRPGSRPCTASAGPPGPATAPMAPVRMQPRTRTKSTLPETTAVAGHDHGPALQHDELQRRLAGIGEQPTSRSTRQLTTRRLTRSLQQSRCARTRRIGLDRQHAGRSGCGAERRQSVRERARRNGCETRGDRIQHNALRRFQLGTPEGGLQRGHRLLRERAVHDVHLTRRTTRVAGRTGRTPSVRRSHCHPSRTWSSS